METSAVTTYNCKSCRTVLFQDSDLSLHEKGGDGVGGSDHSLLTEAVYRKLEKVPETVIYLTSLHTEYS